MSRKRVVVADDLAPVLSEAAALLEESFDVVGKASDGRTALELILLLKPDLAILDITMPEMSGIDVVRELRIRGSKSRIVFLTVHEDPDIVKTCMDAGGLGYVVKLFMGTDLLRAVDEALAGRTFTSSFPSHRSSLGAENGDKR